MKTKQHHRNRPQSLVAFISAIALTCLLAACASTSGGESESKAAASPAPSDKSDTAAKPAEAAATAADSGVTESESVESQIEQQAKKDAKKTAPDVADVAEAPHVVAECKNEAYVKEDKQARNYIKKGKEAMEAGIYGVGFKDLDNYKKWSAMHNTVFQSVSKACAELSECTRKHAKDKDKACASEARAYNDWKHTAKEFTEKVKSVEHTQPPQLCSAPLGMHDPSYCYEKMAKKIDSVCTTDDCKEASQCWRSVNILDGAINQEESACRYMRIKLSKCNGYKEATHRREAAYKRCNYLQDKADLVLAPVL